MGRFLDHLIITEGDLRSAFRAHVTTSGKLIALEKGPNYEDWIFVPNSEMNRRILAQHGWTLR